MLFLVVYFLIIWLSVVLVILSLLVRLCDLICWGMW